VGFIRTPPDERRASKRFIDRILDSAQQSAESQLVETGWRRCVLSGH